VYSEHTYPVYPFFVTAACTTANDGSGVPSNPKARAVKFVRYTGLQQVLQRYRYSPVQALGWEPRLGRSSHAITQRTSYPRPSEKG